VSELRDCGCWFSSNGYGKNLHPSGFVCAFCGTSGLVEGDTLGRLEAQREITRLTGYEPSLYDRQNNCAYLQHLPEVIALMGTERALLHMVMKLSEGRAEAVEKAVEHSLRRCPNIDAHLNPGADRNRLRNLLDLIHKSVKSTRGDDMDSSDHWNTLRDIDLLLDQELK
jgi:hypothetical protein